MIVSLFLFSFTFGCLFVYSFKPFGALDEIGLPTVLGCVLFLVFGFLFAVTPVKKKFRITKRHGKLLEITVIVFSCLSLLYLVFVVKHYGPGPVLYAIRGLKAPPEILYGRYRAQLRLLNLLPPLSIAMVISTLLIKRKQMTWYVAGLLSTVNIIAYAAIYETRHVLIWVVLYWLVIKSPNIKNATKFIKYWPVFIVLFFLFMIIGSIRTGISSADSKYWAVALDIEGRFTDLPFSILWILVYVFSGFARGIANDCMVPMVNFYLPKSFFPGIVQKFVHFGPLELADRYSSQRFAIDGWHTLCLYFGIILALVFYICVLLLLWLIIKKINRVKTIPGWYYAVFLWLCVRVVLIPIGDYFINFGEMTELVLLIIFFTIGDISLTCQRDKKIAYAMQKQSR